MKTKRLFVLLSVGVVALMACSCNREGLDAGTMDEIVFDVDGVSIEAEVATKVSVVTDADLTSNGFAVNCVKGSAGSDTQVWSNAAFTKSGTVWKGDKWWPSSNQSYRFYAVYPSTTMTFAAGGPTIAATNASDFVCAYASAPTYKSSNVLTFNHIFARLKNMTVQALNDYSISNVTISITPKTGGTYNLYSGAGQTNGTGWSSLTSGSATNIANATPGTKTNDLYLVPGSYTLTASWTATKGEYTQTFTGKTVNVSLVAGKTNNITASLTGDATEIQFTVSVVAWADNAVNAGTFPIN